MRVATTLCYCDDLPTFDPDYEFKDETGFVCVLCNANVDYIYEVLAEPDEDEARVLRLLGRCPREHRLVSGGPCSLDKCGFPPPSPIRRARR